MNRTVTPGTTGQQFWIGSLAVTHFTTATYAKTKAELERSSPPAGSPSEAWQTWQIRGRSVCRTR
jgi:hypothetical protein